MRFVPAASRRTTPVPAATPATHTGETREALIAHAAAHGWDVVGHRWLRMTRGTVVVEVWFADISSRVVRARHTIGDVQIREIDIVHNREYRMSLGALVMQWLGVRDPETSPARPSSRRGPAAQSSEFEAISATLAGRPGASAPVIRGLAPRASNWVRTDLSPA
ncbi:hypothetical protein [Williamsia phyllosphaerae]|uniref:Uncharacterized protein n=1 Tax=Williamsia phyllosphaerae TaxID=885042 RepID=A0ABQ1V5V4_9NOCA|nr:hypothetical protein [Williamsia phyllosphaerae]GGF40357.1 hypothetical protein GCM10007298_40090 [Williamsia phyllosphaerae]